MSPAAAVATPSAAPIVRSRTRYASRTRSRAKVATSAAEPLVTDVLELIFEHLPSRVIVSNVHATCRHWQETARSLTTVLHFDAPSRLAAVAARRDWPALRSLHLGDLDDLQCGFLCGMGCRGFAAVHSLDLICSKALTEAGLRTLLASTPGITALGLRAWEGDLDGALVAIIESGICTKLQSLRIGEDEEEDCVRCTAEQLVCFGTACPNLTDVDACGLEGIDTMSLAFFPSLTSLYLRLCSGPTWTSLRPLTKLRILHLDSGTRGFESPGDTGLNVFLHECASLEELVMYDSRAAGLWHITKRVICSSPPKYEP